MTGACPCPSCGHEIERHECLTESGNPPPKTGDVTMCLDCGAFLLFEEGGLVEPTLTVLAEIMADPNVQRLRAAWLELQRQVPHGNKE